MRDRYSVVVRGSPFFPGSPPSAPAVPGRPVPWAGRLGRGCCPCLALFPRGGVCYVFFLSFVCSSRWFRSFGPCCCSCCRGSCRCLRSVRSCLALSRAFRVCACGSLCSRRLGCRGLCGLVPSSFRCACLARLWCLVLLSCLRSSRWLRWSCCGFPCGFCSLRSCLWCRGLCARCSGCSWFRLFWLLLRPCCPVTLFGSFLKGLRVLREGSAGLLTLVSWPAPGEWACRIPLPVMPRGTALGGSRYKMGFDRRNAVVGLVIPVE